MSVLNSNVRSPSGYENADVSPENVAYNNFGHPVSVLGYSRFDFEGAWFTAAFEDGLNVIIEGYRGASLEYSLTLVVDTAGPTWFNAGFDNIDELRLISDPDGAGYQFAMDDFTYYATIPSPIPIPAAFWLFGTALIGLVGFGKRKTRIAA